MKMKKEVKKDRKNTEHIKILKIIDKAYEIGKNFSKTEFQRKIEKAISSYSC